MKLFSLSSFDAGPLVESEFFEPQNVFLTALSFPSQVLTAGVTSKDNLAIPEEK